MGTDVSGRVSYIIGYRKSSPDREKSLFFVVDWLCTHFPQLEILLIEQDQSPQLINNFPKNCKVFFIYNPGPYNRGWAFNYGVKQTNKEILFFGDSDMFMSKENYLKCFEACEEYDAVCPEDVKQENVKIDDYKALTFSDIKNDRTVYTFSGGMIVMKRSSFEKIGGWDENFEGWGAEDNALDHVIKSKLKYIQLFLDTYHIDHERQLFDGNKHPNYNKNYDLSLKIESLQNTDLDNYIEENRKAYSAKGSPDRYKSSKNETLYKRLSKNNVFVLAITTYNRIEYLKQLLQSWYKTKNSAVSWKLIIADDGSDDGTLEFLQLNYAKDADITIVKNERVGVSHQFNTILKELQKYEFDVCFKCDDDILFLQKGWDELYYYAMIESGYQHLIYYSLNWRQEQNRSEIRKDSLVNYCDALHIQGAFFTVTPEIIEKVGFMDTLTFGFRGYEHIDYSWRCCRLGFNDLDSPFDVIYSNDFIGLQIDNYIPSLEMLLYDKINATDDFEKKKKIVYENRTYIPYEENVKDVVGYKYLNVQWRSIAYDFYDRFYELFKKRYEAGSQKNIPSKNSYEFLNYLRSLTSENYDDPFVQEISNNEPEREYEIQKKPEIEIIENNYIARRVQQLLDENRWYKAELEKIKNYYQNEALKTIAWYETQSTFTFLKRKIKSKFKND